MIIEINSDPRLKIEQEALEKALGKPVTLCIKDINHEAVVAVQEGISQAHSIKQDVIPILINSPGGGAHDLISIVSMFKQSKIPISTIVAGHAGSSAAILFAYGSNGMRYISPDASLMIHEVASWQCGKVEELKSEANYVDKLNRDLYEKLAKQCGKNKDYFLDIIHEKKHADWFLDSEEALKHNLADKIALPYFNVNVKVEYVLE
jgi:ATP-dependent Clp protease protease subunit